MPSVVLGAACTRWQDAFKGCCAGGLNRFQVPCCQSPCFCSIEKNDNNFGKAANLQDNALPTGSFTAIYLPLGSHPDSTWRHPGKSEQITSVTTQALRHCSGQPPETSHFARTWLECNDTAPDGYVQMIMTVTMMMTVTTIIILEVHSKSQKALSLLKHELLINFAWN